MLFPNMGKQNHISTLPITRGTIAPGAITTRCDINKAAKAIN
jgi:hypothetical protein